jgi:hypothetical protein
MCLLPLLQEGRKGKKAGLEKAEAWHGAGKGPLCCTRTRALITACVGCERERAHKGDDNMTRGEGNAGSGSGPLG